MIDRLSTLVNRNPLKILGVFTGDSLALESAGYSRIAAYAKVRKTVRLATDTIDPVERTLAMADEARLALSMPADRLVYSLLWYDRCYADWSIFHFAAVNNLATGDIAAALGFYEYLLTHQRMFDSFTSAALHGKASVSVNEVIDKLISKIADTVDNDQLLLNSVDFKCAPTLIKALFHLRFESCVKRILNDLADIPELKGDACRVTAHTADIISELVNIVKRAGRAFGNTDVNFCILAEEAATCIYKIGGNVIDNYINRQSVADYKVALNNPNALKGVFAETIKFVNYSIKGMRLSKGSKIMLANVKSDFNVKSNNLRIHRLIIDSFDMKFMKQPGNITDLFDNFSLVAAKMVEIANTVDGSSHILLSLNAITYIYKQAIFVTDAVGRLAHLYAKDTYSHMPACTETVYRGCQRIYMQISEVIKNSIDMLKLTKKDMVSLRDIRDKYNECCNNWYHDPEEIDKYYRRRKITNCIITAAWLAAMSVLFLALLNQRL